MTDYIAVHRLVVGSKEERHAIQPGERFDARSLGVDDAEVESMLKGGAIRLPSDEEAAPPPPPPAGRWWSSRATALSWRAKAPFSRAPAQPWFPLPLVPLPGFNRRL
jgi:hypothetical protein